MQPKTQNACLPRSNREILHLSGGKDADQQKNNQIDGDSDKFHVTVHELGGLRVDLTTYSIPTTRKKSLLLFFGAQQRGEVVSNAEILF